MSDRFTLRFLLAEGRPTFETLTELWPDEPALVRRDDGVVEMRDGERVLARLDLLSTEDARGSAIVGALTTSVKQHGEGEALEAALFVLNACSGVVLACPQAASEAELEQAMEPLDALWEHLFEHHGGLLQVDGEGVHGEEGPLVAIP